MVKGGVTSAPDRGSENRGRDGRAHQNQNRGRRRPQRMPSPCYYYQTRFNGGLTCRNSRCPYRHIEVSESFFQTHLGGQQRDTGTHGVATRQPPRPRQPEAGSSSGEPFSQNRRTPPNHPAGGRSPSPQRAEFWREWAERFPSGNPASTNPQ